MEEFLNISREYQLLFGELEQLAGFGYWIEEPQTKRILFSDSLFKIYGIPPEATANCLDFLFPYTHPDDLVRVREAQKSLCEEKQPTTISFRILRPDGHLRYVMQTGRLLQTGEDRSFIIATIKDITELRELQLEQILQEGEAPDSRHHKAEDVSDLANLGQVKQRARIAELINDSSIDRLVALDLDMNVIAWNKRSELITGITKEEITGKQIGDFFPVVIQHPAVKKALEQAARGLTSFIPYDRGPQEEGIYENHFIPIKENDGRVIGILNIKHDVAHRIKPENELKALNKALARKNKELKQKNSELLSFAHITGHDLKEPLRKIYTFIELIFLRDYQNLSERGKSHFKRVQAAVQRMGLLTDDILTFSQLNTDDEKLLTQVDLNQTVESVRKTLSDQVASKGVILQAASLPTVRGYNQLLQQLFLNLIGNAIKFQPAGNIPEITIWSEHLKGEELDHPDASADIDFIKITVKDNGIGFEKKYAEKIFGMFQRLHSQEKYPGTGIGLSICRKIVSLHNGFITAQGEEGGGAEFYIYLPASA
jgi:PAS domain S-box-containing protein